MTSIVTLPPLVLKYSATMRLLIAPNSPGYVASLNKDIVYAWGSTQYAALNALESKLATIEQEKEEDANEPDAQPQDGNPADYGDSR